MGEKGWGTFAFEQTCDFVELVFWACGENLGSVHVAPQDCGLVFYDGEGEGVDVDPCLRGIRGCVRAYNREGRGAKSVLCSLPTK